MNDRISELEDDDMSLEETPALWRAASREPVPVLLGL